jgi:hypothetical protein
MNLAMKQKKNKIEVMKSQILCPPHTQHIIKPRMITHKPKLAKELQFLNLQMIVANLFVLN